MKNIKRFFMGNSKILLLAVTIGCLMLNGCGGSTSSSGASTKSTSGATRNTSTSMFTSASDLAKEAMALPTTNKTLGNFVANGKVVVWDRTKDDTFSSAAIKDGILWSRGDSKGYVVIIDRYYDTRVTSYSRAGSNGSTTIPGYRKDASVYVYNLKTGSYLGHTTVRGFNPPANYRTKGTPKAIYGNIQTPMANWINSHFN